LVNRTKTFKVQVDHVRSALYTRMENASICTELITGPKMAIHPQKTSACNSSCSSSECRWVLERGAEKLCPRITCHWFKHYERKLF